MCPECPSAHLNSQTQGLVGPFMAVAQTQACAMGDNPDAPLAKQLPKFRQLDGSPSGFCHYWVSGAYCCMLTSKCLPLKG